MKYIGFLLPLFLIFSCGSAPEIIEPEPISQPAPAAEPILPPIAAVPVLPEPEPVIEPIEEAPIEEPVTEEIFDPDNVPEEIYITVITDIQTIIGQLNTIIRARNYTQWSTYLSESYFAEINSRVFLEERADELHRRDQVVASSRGINPATVQRRNLNSARDYFDLIVVPARQNDRVDEIVFLDEFRVRAYTNDGRGNRLILYDLEIINGQWKIIN